MKSFHYKIPVNIASDWIFAYVGFLHNWISISEIEDLAIQNKLGYIDEELLVQLFTNDDSKEGFLVVMEKIAKAFSYNSSDDFDVLSKKAENKWRLSFLINVINSERSLKEKLMDVSVIWADFRYPKEWRKFIYYMPPEEAQQALGEEKIYQNLIDYVKSEMDKLN